MSFSQELVDYLAAQQPAALRKMSFDEIAANLNTDKQKVRATAYSLDMAGRVALLRDGRNIVGVKEVLRTETMRGHRNTAKPKAKRGRPVKIVASGQPDIPDRFITKVATPSLNQYVHAKRQWEAAKANPFLSGQMGDEFATLAIAEEALSLQAALYHRDERYASLSQEFAIQKMECEDVKREFNEWKGRNVKKLTAEVHKDIEAAKPD